MASTLRPAVFLVPAALCAAWTLFAGKDLNWDLLNYHYYAPFALLAGRLQQDFFAASAQSYLNPLGYVPFYLMLAAGWHSVIASVVLALAHSISIALLYLIAWRLFAHLPVNDRVQFACLAAALGAATSVFWAMVGTSFLDPLLVAPMLAGVLVLLLVVTVGALWIAPSDDYILLPDPAHPVAPLVKVKGGHDRPSQQIYFVDVFQRRARHYETLFPWLHDGATLVPAKLLVPPGETDQTARHVLVVEDDPIVRRVTVRGLRQLGYEVVAKPSGVVVAALEQGIIFLPLTTIVWVIVAVNGVASWDFLWLGIAVLIDAGSGGRAAKR